MARFKRLTDAEARTLTRRELLDRIDAEQAYWFRKKTRTAEDDAAFREFTRIMHAYLPPAVVAEAIQGTIDYIEGRSPGRYWDTRPGDKPSTGLGALTMDANQRAGLEYGLRMMAREREEDGGHA